MRQKVLSVILTLAMCLSLLPAMTLTAAAAKSVSYQTCDENGEKWETAARSDYTVVTSSQTQWTGGWYVVNSSVTLTDKTVSVVGDVHLILKNGCTLTIIGSSGGGGGDAGSGVAGSDGGTGISILSGGSLTVYGQTGHSGELNVIGGSGGNGGGGGQGGSGGNGGNAINGNITVYGGSVIAKGGNGGSGGTGDTGGTGGSGGSAINGSIAIYAGSLTGTGGSGGAGGGSGGIGSGIGGSDSKAVTGAVDFADGYVHLTRAGRDEDAAEVLEWTGSPNSFPQDVKWVKIQSMRVTGVTVTPAAIKIKPGGIVNFAAKITVLTPSGVDPLNVTKGASWTVTGGKPYTMTDGKLTVKANETAQTLTVTAKFGTEAGSATVTLEQADSPAQLVGMAEIGGTTVMPPDGGSATPNGDGTMTVPGGSIITPPGGPSITVSKQAVVDEDGSITLPGGGSATVSGTTVTLPAKGGTITSNEDGTLTVPPASVVVNKNGERNVVPARGGTIAQDGTYTVNPNPVLSDTPATYPPTVSKPANGNVSVSPSSPKVGDTVTISPAPNGDYEVGNVTVRDSSGSKLQVKDNLNGTYSFIQPGETVTIQVTFVPWSQEMPFFDIRPDDWCYDAVRYVNSRGIMGGYSDGNFRPNIQLSRAMLAQVLYNLAGGVPANYQIQYHDVPEGAWYAEAVRWAASEGIITGYSDGSFRPDASITREQFAVMLYRFERSRNGGSAGEWMLRPDYADAERIGDYAREAVIWCTMNGILGGYGDGTLRPKGQTTRAQAAAMLTRFSELDK